MEQCPHSLAEPSHLWLQSSRTRFLQHLSVAAGSTSVANMNRPLSHPLLPLLYLFSPCALYLLLPVLRAAPSSSCHTVHHHPSSCLGSFPLSHREFRESRQGKSSCTPFTWAQTSQLQHGQLTKASVFPLTCCHLSS